MKISKEVELAAITFLKNLEAMRPEMVAAQEAIFNEMCKGDDRDLLNVIDLIVTSGEKSIRYVIEFIRHCETIGGAFLHPQVNAIVRAFQTGSFSEFEDMSEELAQLMISNRVFKRNLEENMVNRFGKDALTKMLLADGLVSELQRRSQEIVKKI